MLFSILKLELKKGILHYLIIYLFFFIWSTLTLIILYLYFNFNSLSKLFPENSEITLAYYPRDQNKISDLHNYFLEYNYIKNVITIPPLEVYNQLKDDLPALSEQEIIKYIPYIIRIELDLNQINLFKKEIEKIKKFNNLSLEILNEPTPSFFSITKWKYLNKFLLFFITIWYGLYLILFYFLYKNLNSFFKDYIETYQLLGGNILIFKLTRILLTVVPIFFLFICSFIFYLIIAFKLSFLFPPLKIFPNPNNIYSLYFFIFSFLFLVFIYPIIIIIILFKKL